MAPWQPFFCSFYRIAKKVVESDLAIFWIESGLKILIRPCICELRSCMGRQWSQDLHRRYDSRCFTRFRLPLGPETAGRLSFPFWLNKLAKVQIHTYGISGFSIRRRCNSLRQQLFNAWRTRRASHSTARNRYGRYYTVTRQGPSVDASRVTAVTFQSQFAMNALDPDFADYCKSRGGGQGINSLILRVLRFQGTVYVISSRMYFTGKSG